MKQFPAFMRRPCNAVKTGRKTSGLAGYVFNGADGSQMVLWRSRNGGRSDRHIHDFDEYAVVIQGTFTGRIGGRKIVLGPGEECFIPAGVPHEGVYSRGYRAIDAFGGKRVCRQRGA